MPVVSANSIAAGKEKEEENVDRVIGLDPSDLERHGPVPTQTSLRPSASAEGVVGIIGLIVVAAILSLSIYFIVRYLL